MSIIEGKFEKPNFLTKSVDFGINWSRRSSLWMFFYATACCGIEAMAVGMPKYDGMDRFGIIPRATPRQADLLIHGGPLCAKMVPVLRRLYEQMAEPRYVIAMGSCAISGGLFQDSYNIIPVNKIIPVDVYVPGCNPRPEALMHGILELQEKIKKESTLVRPRA